MAIVRSVQWTSDIDLQDTSPNCHGHGRGLDFTSNQWLLCTQVSSNSWVLSMDSKYSRKSEYSMMKTPSSYSKSGEKIAMGIDIHDLHRKYGPELSKHQAIGLPILGCRHSNVRSIHFRPTGSWSSRTFCHGNRYTSRWHMRDLQHKFRRDAIEAK